MTRDEWRRKLKARRAAVSTPDQQQASQQVAARITERAKHSAGHAAIFLSFANELNTRPAIEALWQLNMPTVVPVLHPFSKGHLLFLSLTPDTPLIHNRYGIQEPPLRADQVVPLHQIGCLFMPLVGFDQYGNRLGMGGGYYDRTLASWQAGRLPDLHPIGLAYDEQYVEHLPTEPWDVAIPEVITPTRHWHFNNQPKFS
ncbi:5-formyltetrahydrofolate cyclo-ligase [Idiomarina fontislapidosi]|uniref:5-formyltetrahydrofolate cyclo-ligase n=1 Tax=Idiomarina fontislapidosi TaxID=263723 RepID=A0A432Y8G5_9GAMM|nr:5-formyltetrahydrofolate cyclo-ligase [Idiomarina fontislapidosi]PYE33891.1 5-formyltetrahydrofolate cyclo-ligase [Idiomarina fontislapidosi]RUO57278.1 5-formyltetrahydrofolate cyclo-ligase [Idiomarina fontislapidosi]